MSEFSINDKRKIKEEVLEVPENRNVVEAPVAEQEANIPEVVLENIDTYKVAVYGMREKLVKLVQEGFMTEAVAERLMTDFMVNTFNQVVKPKLA